MASAKRNMPTNRTMAPMIQWVVYDQCHQAIVRPVTRTSRYAGFATRSSRNFTPRRANDSCSGSIPARPCHMPYVRLARDNKQDMEELQDIEEHVPKILAVPEQYHFVTEWRFKAPLETVWSVVFDIER